MVLLIPPRTSLPISRQDYPAEAGVIDDLELSSQTVEGQHTQALKRERIEVTGVGGGEIQVNVDGVDLGVVSPATPMLDSILSGDVITLANDSDSPAAYFCCQLKNEDVTIRPKALARHRVLKGQGFEFQRDREYVICAGGGSAEDRTLKMGNYIPLPSRKVAFTATVNTIIAEFER